MSENFDIVIAGAGIVGLSVAQEITRRNPALKIAILDKEPRIGLHASGRNSGVMHCGIFYGSDTLKAQVCASGAARIGEFATEHGIAYDKRGKLIIATAENELPALEKLLGNAAANQINARKISGAEAGEIEPYAAPALGAVHCPDTAVIDSLAVLDKLQDLLAQKGVSFLFDCEVTGLNSAGFMRTSQGDIGFGYFFNCAGAYSDRIAKYFGLAGDYQLLPFKGIYWKLSKAANHKVRANIYPVPDPALPFLGVHLTRVINGDVYIGPTAIPALSRENYGTFENISLCETIPIAAMLTRLYLANEQNFRLLAHNEMAKYSKKYFYEAAKRLMPSLEPEEMLPSPKIGIRPQLVNLRSRKLEMDYIFERTENSLHVLNTISPAFTSSFAFAEMIVERSNVR